MLGRKPEEREEVWSLKVQIEEPLIILHNAAKF